MVNIAVIGIAAVMLAVVFKNSKSEYSIYISVAACILIIVFSLSKLKSVIDSINEIIEYVDIDMSYINILIKIVAITYICEFTSDICKDTGYNSIANQIQIFAKLTILVIAMPIVMSLIDTINMML